MKTASFVVLFAILILVLASMANAALNGVSALIKQSREDRIFIEENTKVCNDKGGHLFVVNKDSTGRRYIVCIANNAIIEM